MAASSQAQTFLAARAQHQLLGLLADTTIINIIIMATMNKVNQVFDQMRRTPQLSQLQGEKSWERVLGAHQAMTMALRGMARSPLVLHSSYQVRHLALAMAHTLPALHSKYQARQHLQATAHSPQAHPSKCQDSHRAQTLLDNKAARRWQVALRRQLLGRSAVPTTQATPAL